MRQKAECLPAYSWHVLWIQKRPRNVSWRGEEFISCSRSRRPVALKHVWISSVLKYCPRKATVVNDFWAVAEAEDNDTEGNEWQEKRDRDRRGRNGGRERERALKIYRSIVRFLLCLQSTTTCSRGNRDISRQALYPLSCSISAVFIKSPLNSGDKTKLWPTWPELHCILFLQDYPRLDEGLRDSSLLILIEPHLGCNIWLK